MSNLLDAIQNSSHLVRHLILSSDIELEHNQPLECRRARARSKGLCEDLIRASGIPYTFLRFSTSLEDVRSAVKTNNLTLALPALSSDWLPLATDTSMEAALRTAVLGDPVNASFPVFSSSMQVRDLVDTLSSEMDENITFSALTEEYGNASLFPTFADPFQVEAARMDMPMNVVEEEESGVMVDIEESTMVQ